MKREIQGWVQWLFPSAVDSNLQLISVHTARTGRLKTNGSTSHAAACIESAVTVRSAVTRLLVFPSEASSPSGRIGWRNELGPEGRRLPEHNTAGPEATPQDPGEGPWVGPDGGGSSGGPRCNQGMGAGVGPWVGQ